MRADPRLLAYAARAEARLQELLPPADRAPARLHEAMRYSALAPGKRIRPVLCLAACEAVGGSPNLALDAACAAELVHAFSLVHDDLPAIDDDDLRRGRPTCHVQFGEAMAILAGDALFALAFQALAEMVAPAEAKAKCLLLLTRASGSEGLVGGEVLDVLSEGEPVDAETLAWIHRRKTGSLLAASCAMGAVLGGGNSREIEALEFFGAELGLAFQIVDDLLNERSTSDDLGKAAGSDQARGKATYPRIYGVAHSEGLAAEAVSRALGSLGECRGDTTFLEEIAHFTLDRTS